MTIAFCNLRAARVTCTKKVNFPQNMFPTINIVNLLYTTLLIYKPRKSFFNSGIIIKKEFNMTRQELINLVLKNTNSYEDFPFNDNTREKILWTAIRQKRNKKIIALIFEKDNDLLIDLKLAPEHGEEVREYDGVFPGYHMNKIH